MPTTGRGMSPWSSLASGYQLHIAGYGRFTHLGDRHSIMSQKCGRETFWIDSSDLTESFNPKGTQTAQERENRSTDLLKVVPMGATTWMVPPVQDRTILRHWE